MNFNEKLTKLRKQKGMSQEELGEQFNVTRQTVSKWELGQTTPEMDKLNEISKFFGVTVDELISDKEMTSNYTEDNQKDKNGKDDSFQSSTESKSALAKILVVILIILIIFAVIIGVWKIKTAKTILDSASSVTQQTISEQMSLIDWIKYLFGYSIDAITDGYNEMKEDQAQFDEQYNRVKDNINNGYNEMKEDQAQFDEQYNRMKDDINNGYNEMKENQAQFYENYNRIKDNINNGYNEMGKDIENFFE